MSRCVFHFLPVPSPRHSLFLPNLKHRTLVHAVFSAKGEGRNDREDVLVIPVPSEDLRCPAALQG